MKILLKSSLPIIGALNLANLNANDVSSYPADKCALIEQDKNILVAINHLERACEQTKSIQDIEEMQEAIASQLKACLNCLKTEFFSKNSEKAKEAAALLYENLDEVLESCPNAQMRENIVSEVNDMIDTFEG